MNSAIKILAIAVALHCASLSFAVEYSFSRIFTGESAGQICAGAAMNDNGLVAIAYTVGTNPCLVTTDGVTSTFVAGGTSPNSLSLNNWNQLLSLNNNGFVAFRGYSSHGYSILASNGPTTKVIAADTNHGGSFIDIGSFAVSMNDSGMVAFTALRAGGPSFQMFEGDGGASTLLVDSPTAKFPAINNAGMVAYTDYNASAVAIRRESQTYAILGTSPFSMPDINSLGCVAFCAMVGGAQEVVIGDGVSATKYIDASAYKGGLTGGRALSGGVPDCAINDDGLVAFGACRDSLGVGYGIFTGPDPATDKVIMEGDALDGFAVTSLFFSRNGLNNNGQIAFWARLSDGTQGVWAANPVPEPSTFVLLFAGAFSLLAYAWRRRRSAM
jgi:hypothetical protein